MSQFTVEKMRIDSTAIFRAAVKAVDAEKCVRRFMKLEGDRLRIGDKIYNLGRFERILVVGTGKASPRMGVTVEGILGDRLWGGVINTKYGHSEPLERIEILECGHPVPDEAGVEGTRQILDLLEGADENTLVICLISGGGSALMPAPVDGISLEEKQETTRALLECGANIVELNSIRKHLSQVKGGGLARVAFPATVVALMLSDVIGDPLDVIASGPTVPDSSTFETCMGILEKYDLIDVVPRIVRERFDKGMGGFISDTPKPGDEALARCYNLVVGSNGLAVEGAKACAKTLGYNTLVLSTRVEGEAREVAHVYTAIAKEILISKEPIAPPACIIAGGETTVLVRGKGKGGRNQELTLAGAIQLSGWEKTVLFSGGTDGTDGPTDAAGAISDGQTVSRAEEVGLFPETSLKNNDSYNFFKPLGDLVITGPTGTNVADVAFVMVGDD